MTIQRRQLVLLGAAAGLPVLSRAQATMPIEQPKFFYGFPAGSAGDICARRVAERIGGSPYAKNAALDALKTSAPDGSSLTMAQASALTIYPHIYRKLSYDPFADFMPISTSSVMQHGLAVGPMVPESVKSVRDFVAWAKANPDKANFGSPGAGSTPHFIGALLALNTGVDMKHVPYRGSVPGVTDVVAGQIAAMVTPAGDFLQNHRAGKLRLLATSGKTRLPFATDVPTFAEQGQPELTMEEWFGFYAPARTPPAVIAAANAAINKALADRAVIDGLGVVGLIAQGSTPEEQLRSQRAEFERWEPLVKRIGFTADS
jgi:tripartite-type tricarboxylate transporter receptor subunit TctC